MSVLKLRSWSGDVEIGGNLHRASYDGDAHTLTIHGMEIGVAGDLLERMATGSIVGVQQAMAGLPGEQALGAPAGPPPAAPAAAPPPPPVPAPAPGGPTVSPAQPVAAPAPAAVPVPAQPPAAQVAEPTAPQAPPAPAAPGVVAPTVVPPAAPASSPAAWDEATLVVELNRGTQLRHAIVTLEKAGAKEADAIVAACRKYAAQVPYLGRIANLEDRVRRTLEALKD